MSRDIRFRAWNYTTETMEIVEELTYNHGKIEQVNTDKDRILFPDKECELMQYTGLKDKNGTDVYEGDILSWFFGTSVDDATKEATRLHSPRVVEWTRAGFDMPLYGSEFEIIGNIYEHPNLLETEAS